MSEMTIDCSCGHTYSAERWSAPCPQCGLGRSLPRELVSRNAAAQHWELLLRVLVVVLTVCLLAGIVIAFIAARHLPPPWCDVVRKGRRIFMWILLPLMLYWIGRILKFAFPARLHMDRCRQPALYLRSFGDDAGRPDLLRAAPETHEGRLVDALQHVGPVVTCAKPGEILPELGASRVQLGEAWQEIIRFLLSRAKFVVIRPGSTQGISWEIQLATSIVRPDRLLIFIPELDATRRLELWRMTEELLPCELPRLSRRKKAIVFLYFTDTWTPILVEKRIGFWTMQVNYRKLVKPFLERFEEKKRPGVVGARGSCGAAR